MNESATSVSKKEQSLFDAPAAVSVISNDDIRGSGATNIPGALRVVPGLNVAAVNSREWAVSARGFNSVFSNKRVRAVLKPTTKRTVRAAASRAVRTPSALEGKDAFGVVASAPTFGPDGGRRWSATAIQLLKCCGLVNRATASNPPNA